MDMHAIRRDLGFAWTVLRRRPFQVFLQVTNRCNMRCSFCDFWPNGVLPGEELTLDDYRRVEEQLTQMGTFLISLEGGEPFIRPDIFEIVRIFGRRHLAVLYTNGWYVDEQAARTVFAGGLAQIGISIDYPDAARHDANRGLAGAHDRAWLAVELCRDAAPRGGRQVHVMTVLMRDNANDLERLLLMSASRGVGHYVTLLSNHGTRWGKCDKDLPAPGISARLLDLWRRYPHLRIFRDYLAKMDTFLAHGAMPVCRAGLQSFNIDHVGNVAPCIERIDTVAGRVRCEPLSEIHKRLVKLNAGKECQQCWTACRGYNQALGKCGTLRNWIEAGTRMRSH